jgi:hypothetical protein
MQQFFVLVTHRVWNSIKCFVLTESYLFTKSTTLDSSGIQTSHHLSLHNTQFKLLSLLHLTTITYIQLVSYVSSQALPLQCIIHPT